MILFQLYTDQETTIAVKAPFMKEKERWSSQIFEGTMIKKLRTIEKKTKELH